VTPNWTLDLPGNPYDGPDPEGHVGKGTMRWVPIGPPQQPSTLILLGPPAAGPFRDCAIRDPAGNSIRIQNVL
jgi:hypothetical protein